MHADHAMLFTDVADITKKQQRQLIQVTEKIADIYDREWDIANNFCSLLSEIAPREVWNNCSGIQGNSRLFGSKSSEFARNVRGLDLFIVVMVISASAALQMAIYKLDYYCYYYYLPSIFGGKS